MVEHPPYKWDTAVRFCQDLPTRVMWRRWMRTALIRRGGRIDTFHHHHCAGRQDKGRPAAFQAEDRGVRLSLPAPKGNVAELVYCTGLENRRSEMIREFESHRFRQLKDSWPRGRRQRFAKPSSL